MPDLRPVVAPEHVLALLGQHFNTPISNLAPAEGGQVARTFAFSTDGQDFIIRFTHDNMLDSNLPKEAYLARKFASTAIPIAPVLHVGRLGALYFAISRKMPGRMLEELSPQEVCDLLPQLLDILAALHSIDVSDTQGSGIFNYQGKGLFNSWSDHLHMINKEEAENDYFGKWYNLFDETFLERDVYESLYRRMCDLLVHCPEDRYLIHGGFSLRNVLAQDGRISAVLDWLYASYGDFVYDIAILDFWTPWLGIREAFQEYHLQRQGELPFYESDNYEGYQVARTLIQLKLNAFAG